MPRDSGKRPDRPLHNINLENLADPHVEIPGLDDEQRERLLTGARNGSRGTFTLGAPVKRPVVEETPEVVVTAERRKAHPRVNGTGGNGLPDL